MGLGQHRSNRDVSDTLEIDFVHTLGPGSYSGEKFGAWVWRPSCIPACCSLPPSPRPVSGVTYRTG